MDWRLDPTTGDLDLSTGSIEPVTGVDAIAQECLIRLRTFLGEWFLDERIGVPYFQFIFEKPRRQNLIDQVFKEVIATTPGVLSIRTFNQTFNAGTRELSISFVADTIAGPVDYSTPFIVTVV
jgi:hypothetical protein